MHIKLLTYLFRLLDKGIPPPPGSSEDPIERLIGILSFLMLSLAAAFLRSAWICYHL